VSHTLAPYGTSPWGTGSYGSGSSTIGIENAIALGTNRVLVALTAEPKHEDPFAAGDALNPQTWQLTRLDTGDAIDVVAVREFDPPFLFELATLDDLGSHLVSHRVESSTLLAAAGFLISDPNEFDFPGAIVTFDPIVETDARRFEQRDIANPPLSDRVGGFGGTLVMGADGDYETESGAALVKKLVIRRLVTVPGEFFHLPDYGVGLAVKEPVPGGGIVALKAAIERQARLEPDVEDARASLTIDRRGVLTILLRVQLARTGQEIQIGLNADPRSGNVVEL
jgi:hypothetical protein